MPAPPDSGISHPACRKARLPRPCTSARIAHALALACFGAAPFAFADTPAPLAVTLLDGDGPAVQLRLRIPAGMEPGIELSNGPGAAAGRVVVSWPGAVALDRPLPAVGGDVRTIRSLALRAAGDTTRLELVLGQPVRAQLRRVADSWLLRLDPDDTAPRSAPATLADTAEPRPAAAAVARPAARPAHDAAAVPAAAAPAAAANAAAAPVAVGPVAPDAAAHAVAAPGSVSAPSAPAARAAVPTATPPAAPAAAPAAVAAAPTAPVVVATSAATGAAAAAATTPPLPSASPAPTAPRSGTGEPEQLLVDVSVNGRALADVVRAEISPARGLLLPVDAWTEARLTAPPQRLAMSDGTPAYALATIPGATWTVDRQALALHISVPADAFAASRIAAQAAPPPMPERQRRGAVLNYDLSASTAGAGGGANAGAFLEAMAFGPFGNVVDSVLLRDGPSGRHAQRLDTFWRYDMPGRMQTLVVGDTLGVGGGWSRPVRYAGVRWGRDFAMRPGFVTLPQLALSGQAALPSTVEVLVNNARRISQQVPPGPFELSNVPIVTGAGEINLVVTDLLGHETVVRQGYYASPRLLAPGLTDFSFEGGKMRFGYGDDTRYRDGFAAATLRAGLTRGLTGEARVEAQAARRAAGVELAGLLGGWAVARVAFAHSQGSVLDRSESGHLLLAGIERTTLHGGGAIEYMQASAGFAPFGELASAAAAGQRTRQRLVVSAGGPLVGKLGGGASYVRQVRWDGERVTLAGISLSMPVAQRASVNLSLNRQLDGPGDWRAAFNLSMALDDGDWLAGRLDRDDNGQASATVSASRPAPAGPGLGWNVEASSRQRQRARAAFQYNASAGELTGELAADAHGAPAARAGARGSLGTLGGLSFASRPVGQGSFAVVEVPGMAGVPIMRSHQVVGRTGSDGRAFVPGLLPWQRNLLEIDPDDLPLDATVTDVSREVTPYAGSGVLVKFPVRRTRQALVLLRQPGGEPVPLGAQVRVLPDGPAATAGKRGEVWLAELPPGALRLRVDWPGASCEVRLPAPAAGTASPERIGPLECKREGR